MNRRVPFAMLLCRTLLLALAACSKLAPPPEPVRAVRTTTVTAPSRR